MQCSVIYLIRKCEIRKCEGQKSAKRLPKMDLNPALATVLQVLTTPNTDLPPYPVLLALITAGLTAQFSNNPDYEFPDWGANTANLRKY